MQLFYTGSADVQTNASVSSAAWRPTAGRPDLEALVAEAREAASQHGPLHVHCCGPRPFANTVRKACYTPIGEAVHYHAENFEL